MLILGGSKIKYSIFWYIFSTKNKQKDKRLTKDSQTDLHKDFQGVLIFFLQLFTDAFMVPI